MNSEVAWVLVSSGTQVQPQIILILDYPPDYLSVSYDYALFYKNNFKIFFFLFNLRIKHILALSVHTIKSLLYIEVTVTVM